MWVRVRISGVMAHGAMPLTGINSAYPLSLFLLKVQELEAQLIAQFGQHEFLGQPSITPTIARSPVNGEPQKNVMPGSAETILDLRLIPGQDGPEIAGRLQALLDDVVSTDERLQGELEVLEIRQPTNTNRSEPVVKALAAAHEAVTGRSPIYGGVPGSTDGTILHARKNIPIVTCGPGDIYIPHHIDEWVSIEEIKTAVRLYVVAAIRFLGVQSPG